MQTTQNYGLKKPAGTDPVNINDINDNMDVIDEALNKVVKQRTITLTASGWSGTYPYSQAVTAPGIVASDSIKVISVYMPSNATEAQVKAWTKASNLLMHNPGGVSDGKIIFKAYKRPDVDFQVITEGG